MAVKFFCGHIVDCGPDRDRITEGWQDFDYDGILASLHDQSARDAAVLRAAEEHYELQKERMQKGHEQCDCDICRAVRGDK